jgi:hypothetical protein
LIAKSASNIETRGALHEGHLPPDPPPDGAALVRKGANVRDFDLKTTIALHDVRTSLTAYE